LKQEVDNLVSSAETATDSGGQLPLLPSNELVAASGRQPRSRK
jgi:hypothetical protein